MSDLPPIRGHCAEYFGAERDYIWNEDYLDLLARRLDLGQVDSLADIGCGIGHWSAHLHPRLADGAVLVGVDRDPDNIAGFVARMRPALRPGGAVLAVRGDASALPLPDAAVAASTCQTLLIHVRHPAAVLREMVRITRPGGLVLCVEPNNLLNRFPAPGLIEETPPGRLARLSEMAWRYALGRTRRGLGQEYLGELLPGLFAGAGLADIRVWQSDRPWPFIPPYAAPHEQAALDAIRRWQAAGTGPFDKLDARRNVLAGGGTGAFFDAAWADQVAQGAAMARAMAEGRWHSAGGTLFYVVAGRVPAG
jgi:SAM-dependent methyltransferase